MHAENTAEQIVVTGKIRPNGSGAEIITFALDLTRLDPKTKKLVCIVNVPEEGRDRAPVYIKQTT